MEDNCCGHEHIKSLPDVLEEVLSIHVANCFVGSWFSRVHSQL